MTVLRITRYLPESRARKARPYDGSEYKPHFWRITWDVRSHVAPDCAKACAKACAKRSGFQLQNCLNFLTCPDQHGIFTE